VAIASCCEQVDHLDIKQMILYILERDDFFFGIDGESEIYPCLKDRPQILELRVILIPTLPVVSVPTE